MPRVTKADLTIALEGKNKMLREVMEDLRVKQIALDKMEARVAVRDREIKALKAKRERSPRSRSPRRDAMSAAATHRVLNLVQHFERDAVIDEQRETIARQQREIASLRRGDGPIGEVLLHNWRQSPGGTTDYAVSVMTAQTTPVNTTLASLQRLASAAYDVSLWGGVSAYSVTTLSPVTRLPSD